MADHDSGTLWSQDPVAHAQATLQAALEDAHKVDLSWLRSSSLHGGWALAEDTLQLLASLVMHARPQHILEFGSGVSTRVLAWASAELKPCCHITSVDHDPEFLQSNARPIAGERKGCHLKYHLAPIVVRENVGQWLPMYYLQKEEFACGLPADIILIDGPPAILGGREGVLYQSLDFARPGTLVLLDDARRAGEQMALKRWQENFDQAVEISLLPGFTKGLAAIIVREPIQRADLHTYVMRLTIQQLARYIPAGSSLILVDENRSGIDEVAGCRTIPFLENMGQYWGPPDDDETAIRELERLRRGGAEFIIFVWSSFWWLDYYSEFQKYLRSRFCCLLEDERAIVFDLRVLT